MKLMYMKKNFLLWFQQNLSQAKLGQFTFDLGGWQSYKSFQNHT